jgi:hypothetical protein
MFLLTARLRQVGTIIIFAMSKLFISRREALRRTVIFSTGLMGLRGVSSLHAETPARSFSDGGLDLLALGDFGSGNANQSAVANQMAAFARGLKKPLAGVLAVGDNFYGKLETERFSRHFEEMCLHAFRRTLDGKVELLA